MRGFQRIPLIVLIPLILLIILSFVLALNLRYRPQGLANTSGTFPEFSGIDIFGDEILSSRFDGRKIFVQFLDPTTSEQIDSLKKISSVLISEEIPVLIFLKGGIVIRGWFGSRSLG